MRLREHTAAACLLTIIICVSASLAQAQDYMQPPFVPAPPGMPTLVAGRFYFQAGVKYRGIESFAFSGRTIEVRRVVIPLTVPFGPTVPGDFGVGTGRAGFVGSTVASVSWDYDNGRISSDIIPPGPGTGTVPSHLPITPDNPAVGLISPALPTACSQAPDTPPPDSITLTCNGDSFWGYSVSRPEVGRYYGTISGTGTCCDGLQAARSIGSFSIVDPSSQVNNFTSGSIASSTSATFEVAANDLSYTMYSIPFGEREFGNKVWSLAFETGYQLYDFFDLFYGFSWFSANNSITTTNTGLVGTPSGTTIVDTYPFASDDTTAWPIFNFNSSTSIINGDAFNNYHLSTNSPLRGIAPNRQFVSSVPYSVAGVPLPTINVTEVLTNTAAISVFETRLGSRTWTPLFGMGRLGATLGVSLMPAYYKIAGNRNYTTTDLPDPVVLSESRLYEDWRPHYGVFAGGDLALAYGPAFLNASWDYTWANTQSFQLFSIDTSFNPGGMTVGLAGGFLF